MIRCNHNINPSKISTYFYLFENIEQAATCGNYVYSSIKFDRFFEGFKCLSHIIELTITS